MKTNRNSNFFHKQETPPENNPAVRRAALDAQVESFLKSGGKVQRVPGYQAADVVGRAHGVNK